MLGTAGAASAHAPTPTVVIAPNAPPPHYDTFPPPPTADAEVMTWPAGHWMWDDGNWQCEPGCYVGRPAPTAAWDPGHSSQESLGGYVWIDAHWRS
jgi:hypothetical protein